MLSDKVKEMYRVDSKNEKLWKLMGRGVKEDDDLSSFLKDSLKDYNPKDIKAIFNAKGANNSHQFEMADLLHRRKYLLLTLLRNGHVKTKLPFVVEFTGTPRSGKSTTIHNLKRFFEKAGFKVHVIEELTTSKFYKNSILPLKETMSLGEYNLLILNTAFDQLKEAVQGDFDIVLIDRGINDRQIWNYIRLNSDDLTMEEFSNAAETYSKFSKEWINTLVVLKADSMISIQRDYISTLYLEPRRFNNKDNIDTFNNAMREVQEFHESSVTNFASIDTDHISLITTCMIVANIILDNMIKYFILDDIIPEDEE